MHKRNILFLSSWYPNRIKPTHGNFVHQHAIAASLENHVRLIYVCLDDSLHQSSETVFEQHPFPVYIVYLKKSNLPIVGMIWNYLRMILTYFRMLNQLKREGFQPDLIHANVVYPIGIVARLLSWKHRIPYIISEHWTCYSSDANPKPSGLQMSLTRWAAKKATLILPVSEDLATSMKQTGIQTDMNVVYNVIDTDLFVPTAKSNRELLRLVHVSSLDEVQKNPALLFRAFSEVHKFHPNIHLDIVSDGDFSILQGFIADLGIQSHVTFHGMQTAQGVARILQQADVFVLSSRFENLPCVLIEAISCGVPIVSTNVGGIKEIVHNENGMLVPSENQSALVEAINQVILRLEDYRPEAMHKEAVQLFSYQSIGVKLSNVYQSVRSTYGQ